MEKKKDSAEVPDFSSRKAGGAGDALCKLLTLQIFGEKSLQIREHVEVAVYTDSQKHLLYFQSCSKAKVFPLWCIKIIILIFTLRQTRPDIHCHS